MNHNDNEIMRLLRQHHLGSNKIEDYYELAKRVSLHFRAHAPDALRALEEDVVSEAQRAERALEKIARQNSGFGKTRQ